jgi:predicted Zn-dependent protease
VRRAPDPLRTSALEPDVPPRPAPDSEQRLEAALRNIVEQLPSATPQQRAFLLKRAGDVCVGMSEPRKALGWYGRAVDQHLELGDAEQAATLCRLIIYVQPDAVRARCTLTWIAIGAERHPEAAEQLGAYLDAARRAGQNEIAAAQLEWMFETAASAQLRRDIVAGLRTLGDDARADRLAERAHAPVPPGGPSLWERVLDATVRHQRQR